MARPAEVVATGAEYDVVDGFMLEVDDIEAYMVWGITPVATRVRPVMVMLFWTSELGVKVPNTGLSMRALLATLAATRTPCSMKLDEPDTGETG
jgi:hypothetical protein